MADLILCESAVVGWMKLSEVTVRNRTRVMRRPKGRNMLVLYVRVSSRLLLKGATIFTKGSLSTDVYSFTNLD